MCIYNHSSVTIIVFFFFCRKFVLIFAIQNLVPLCHMTKFLNEGCQKNYTTEQVYKIKRGLRNAIMINPVCQCTLNALDLIADSHLSSMEKCMQGYMADAVLLSSVVANHVLEMKAYESGLNKSDLVIEKVDYLRVTSQLANTSFMGHTGTLQFDKNCHRVANSFAGSNVIIAEDDIESHSFLSSELHLKAYIDTYGNGGRVVFMDGYSNSTFSSSFVFKDDTTDIPSDSNKRFYKRCKSAITPAYLCINPSLFCV